MGKTTDEDTPSPGGPWRVEWHCADRVKVVDRLEHGYPHHTALDLFVGRLQNAGCYAGIIELVAEASGAVAARRRLDRPLYRVMPPPRRERRAPSRPDGLAPLVAPGGGPEPTAMEAAD